ncbi:CD1375 family protein [Oribacterium sp. C9]|nr:CD1375 family protein [Oribacterium sp. C9]
MSRAMAKVYANLIIKGVKTINDVPEKIRSEVVEVLIEMGHEELTKG